MKHPHGFVTVSVGLSLVAVWAVTAHGPDLELPGAAPRPIVATAVEIAAVETPAGGETLVATRSSLSPTPEKGLAATLVFRAQVRHTAAPIPGASLFIVGDDGTLAPLGRTDDNGRLDLRLPSEAPVYLTVLARREGFAPRLCNVGTRRTGTVAIGLTEEAVLRGRVIDIRGTPVPGAQVVAFPSEYPIKGQGGVNRIRRGSHPGAVGETDALGNFELHGLARGDGHVLAAASETGFSDRVGGLPGGDPVTLVTKELIGCYVKIELADGSPLPVVTTSSSTGVGLWVDWRGAPAQPLAIDFTRAPVVPPFQFGLLPLNPREIFDLGHPQTPGAFLCLGLLNHPMDGDPPTVSLRGRWPRVGAFEVQARLETWRPGFPTQITRLPCEPFEVGTLVLDLRTEAGGYPGAGCSPGPDVVSLQVELEDQEDGSQLIYSIHDLSAPPRLTVPCGRYELTVSPNGSSQTRWSMATGNRLLDVTPGEDTHVDLIAPDLGAVSFDVRREDGSSVDGKLTFFLQRYVDGGESEGLEWVSFERPPYCLPRLPAGNYAFHRLRSHRVDSLRVVPPTFRVDPGGHTSVEMVLVGGG